MFIIFRIMKKVKVNDFLISLTNYIKKLDKEIESTDQTNITQLKIKNERIFFIRNIVPFEIFFILAVGLPLKCGG